MESEPSKRFSIRKRMDEYLEGDVIMVRSMIFQDSEGHDHKVDFQIGKTDKESLVLAIPQDDAEFLKQIQLPQRSINERILRSVERSTSQYTDPHRFHRNLEQAEQSVFQEPVIDHPISITQDSYIGISKNPDRTLAIREAVRGAIEALIGHHRLILKEAKTIEQAVDELLN